MNRKSLLAIDKVSVFRDDGLFTLRSILIAGFSINQACGER